jgi:F-type H+-transporting ATPase subunit a
MDHRLVWLRLPTLFGVDMSVTPEVGLLWAAAAVTFLSLVLACRRRSLVAHGPLQNLIEGLIDFVDREVVRESVGPDRTRWGFFLFTLFFFILFCNLLGILLIAAPYHALTANLSVTASLALMVFVLTIAVTVRRRGIGGFLRRFVPSGIPAWLLPLVAPIEIVSWAAKPFSLAIRLFANMLAGHTIVLVFIGMQMAAAWYLKSVPLIGAVAMAAFEIFVSLIQALIFTMLTGFYLREALE